jgi:hypothetical protein
LRDGSQREDTGTATGQLFRTIVTSISEWERGVIGERTREALAYKRRNGEWVAAIPYGLKLAADGKHPAAVPAEGKVLARITKERDRGLSYGLIADGLNADRIRTKCGGRWYAATVRSVLATARRRETVPGSDGDPSKDWVGGSTGSAVGTAKNIAAAVRARGRKSAAPSAGHFPRIKPN